MDNLNRRDLLRTAAMFGIGGAGMSLIPALQGCAHPPGSSGMSTPQLNTALLTDVESKLGSLAEAFAQGNQASADYLEYQVQMARFVAELNRANGDAAIKKSVQNALQKGNLPSIDDFVDRIGAKVVQYVPNYPVANFRTVFSRLPMFDPTVPTETRTQRVRAQLQAVTENGGTYYLTQTAGLLASRVSSVAGQYTPDHGIDCGGLNFTMAALGTIATNLAIMCALPEPLLVVICPSAGGFGIATGVLAILSWAACG